MIEYLEGNLLLDAKAEALVNTVNEVGVMGKGIALQFRNTFPEVFPLYKRACTEGKVRVGTVFPVQINSILGKKWIVNFPTKKHWRDPSKLEWITEGLQSLRSFIETNKIQSIAIPALGCQNGGLDWRDVKPEIEKALQDLEGVEIRVYLPLKTYLPCTK